MKKSDECSVCGSVGCVDLSHLEKIPKVACSECGCKGVVGVIRQRDDELALVDWSCRRCHFKWSDARVLSLELVVGVAFWSEYEGCERCLHG